MAIVSNINIPLSTLPELDQSKYPEVYAELLRLRNAIKILQAVIDPLGAPGAAGLILKSNGPGVSPTFQ